MSQKGGESLKKMSQLSSFSASSVRDLLPDSCCLNIEDEDEGTLTLVTRFMDSYLTHTTTEQTNNPDSDESDSDASTESESEPEVPFDIRPEDQILDDEINRFRDRGCGCHLDDGKIFFVVFQRSWLSLCKALFVNQTSRKQNSKCVMLKNALCELFDEH